MLKFISDKNGVTRAEIENHLRAGIAEMVDTEFNKGMRGGVIPVAVYAQWIKDRVANGVDAMQILKNCIGDFFVNPTKENYDRLVIIDACYEENLLKSDQLAYLASSAYYRTMSSLSDDIYRKIEDASHNNRAVLVRVAKSSDELFVFSVRYE
jgi:hypothetical protein